METSPGLNPAHNPLREEIEREMIESDNGRHLLHLLTLLTGIFVLVPMVPVLYNMISKNYQRWVPDSLSSHVRHSNSARAEKRNIALFATIALLITCLIGAYFTIQDSIRLALTMLLLTALALLALIDLRHKVLPNKITIPLLIAGLALSLTGYTVPWQGALLGMSAGFLILFIPASIYSTLTGQEGVGFGDFKLMAGVGAWLGWQPILHIVVVAGLSAAILGTVYLRIKKLPRSTTIPFGPFLVAACAVVTVTPSP